MRRLSNPWIVVLIIAAVMVPLFLIAWFSDIRTFFTPQAATNLLQNPGFEDGFTVQGNRLTVPNGWKADWSTSAPIIEGGSAGPCVMPEYKPMCDFAYRRHSGLCSACFFAFYSMTDGVLYQTVTISETNATVQAKGSAQAWASPNDATDPNIVPPSPGELYVSIGIDPDGQTDFRRLGVLWSPWVLVREKFVEIHSPVVQVNGNKATVYYRAATKYAQKHGDVYWDDASLWVLSAGTLPTATPRPTYTPRPTLQPLPTYTPQVCPTVVCPTSTPGGECDYALIRAIVGEEVRRELDRTQWGSVP